MKQRLRLKKKKKKKNEKQTPSQREEMLRSTEGIVIVLQGYLLDLELKLKSTFKTIFKDLF